MGAPVGSVGWRSSVGGLTCEGKRAWGRARQRRGGAPDLNKKHADCDGSGSGLGSVGGLLSRTELRRGGRQWNEKGKGRGKLGRARVGRGWGAM